MTGHPPRPDGRGLRRALIAGEVALAVVLVAGAGLMMRTVVNLMNVDAGFVRSRLVTFAVALPAATYPAFDQRVQLYDRLIDRFSAMPGINGVAAVSGLPPQREYNGFGTDIENHTPPPEKSELVGFYQTVTSGYFEAMRIPIVKGRGFQGTDRTGAPVAIVNEAFALVAVALSIGLIFLILARVQAIVPVFVRIDWRVLLFAVSLALGSPWRPGSCPRGSCSAARRPASSNRAHRAAAFATRDCDPR